MLNKVLVGEYINQKKTHKAKICTYIPASAHLDPNTTINTSSPITKSNKTGKRPKMHKFRNVFSTTEVRHFLLSAFAFAARWKKTCPIADPIRLMGNCNTVRPKE